MMDSRKQGAYEPLTPLMCVRLAAPHTWAGPSVLTTVFGGLFSIASGFEFDPAIWCALLVVAVFAQSAVNTLNDWADHRAGTDTLENSDDPSDAVLVYNNPNPRFVLTLAIAYMLVALACGIVCLVWCGSMIPAIIGLVGALAIVCYSNGKLPISYLPLGEVFSGVVMGGLIPLADVCVFATHSFPFVNPLGLPANVDWLALLSCIAPFVIGVGLVMATQNNCDIERDAAAGRKTLPVCLGKRSSLILYRVFIVLWAAVVLHCAFWYFNSGFWAACVTLVFGLGTLRFLLICPLTHEVRGPAMGAIMKANLFINGALIIAMLVSPI